MIVLARYAPTWLLLQRPLYRRLGDPARLVLGRRIMAGLIRSLSSLSAATVAAAIAARLVSAAVAGSVAVRPNEVGA